MDQQIVSRLEADLLPPHASSAGHVRERDGMLFA
jgi:hypothetical protein